MTSRFGAGETTKGKAAKVAATRDKKDDKGRDGGDQRGKSRGLDRADQVAGEQGSQGRADATAQQKDGHKAAGATGKKGESGVAGGPTSKDECKHGGWKNLGFRNQGQCVSHVVSHRK